MCRCVPSHAPRGLRHTIALHCQHIYHLPLRTTNPRNSSCARPAAVARPAVSPLQTAPAGPHRSRPSSLTVPSPAQSPAPAAGSRPPPVARQRLTPPPRLAPARPSLPAPPAPASPQLTVPATPLSPPHRSPPATLLLATHTHIQPVSDTSIPTYTAACAMSALLLYYAWCPRQSQPYAFGLRIRVTVRALGELGRRDDLSHPRSSRPRVPVCHACSHFIPLF